MYLGRVVFFVGLGFHPGRGCGSQPEGGEGTKQTGQWQKLPKPATSQLSLPKPASSWLNF